MEPSKEAQQKVQFCLKLGNPVPCDDLSVLNHINDLGYITTSQRLTVDSEFSDVYVYNIYEAFSLLVGEHRIRLINGDILLRCVKDDHEVLLVPLNKDFFEVGGHTTFDRYIFKDSVYVDKQVTRA